MNCRQTKSSLSAYLDGALSGAQRHALSGHMQTCADCAREYRLLRQSHTLLTSVGRPQIPPDLALKLRVAISREAARARHSRFEGVLVRLDNLLNAFLLPATAGLATAVVIFGLLMGFFALPPQLQASSEDVPLMLYSAPELQASAYNLGRGIINEDSLVVEVSIDENGRVEDYRILASTKDAQMLLPQVKNMLIFTVFRPAMAMGHPTVGRAVLTFSRTPRSTRLQG
jgi:anti-sigma factor RsiW